MDRFLNPKCESRCGRPRTLTRKNRRYTNDFAFPVIAVRGSMEKECHIWINTGAPREMRGLQSDNRTYLMFGRKMILLSDHDTFLEEVLVDGDSILFGHQHFRFIKFNPFKTLQSDKLIWQAAMTNWYDRPRWQIDMTGRKVKNTRKGSRALEKTISRQTKRIWDRYVAYEVSGDSFNDGHKRCLTSATLLDERHHS